MHGSVIPVGRPARNNHLGNRLHDPARSPGTTRASDINLPLHALAGPVPPAEVMWSADLPTTFCLSLGLGRDFRRAGLSMPTVSRCRYSIGLSLRFDLVDLWERQVPPHPTLTFEL